MYGLVNKAIEGLVRERFGDRSWEEIQRDAGIGDPCFVNMQAYPDELTYRLVASASKVLLIPQEVILEGFGRHWILFTAAEGYGGMLDLCGLTLREFLLNLHTLHTRIELLYPQLKPPSFVCRALDDGAIEVNYYSDRVGLEPIVKGILEGLGERFSTPVEVTHTQRRREGAHHDTFVVRETGSSTK